jgi:hypothetical protein
MKIDSKQCPGSGFCINISAPLSAGNKFQDLPHLCESADNAERYI